MTTFYAVSNDQKQVWIAAHESAGEHRILVWIANDATWRRNLGLENDFYAFERDMTFREISPTDVAQQLPNVTKLNITTAGWLLTKLQREPAVSSEDLGLPVSRGKRPTHKLADELIGKTGQWVTVKTYTGKSADVSRRARVLASEIRTGKKASLRKFGKVETRVRKAGDSVHVEAMVQLDAKQAASSVAPAVSRRNRA
jgi:hypothetical protein